MGRRLVVFRPIHVAPGPSPPDSVSYWARQYNDSINQFRQAITFDPTFVSSYVCFAWVLAANGDTKAALEACAQAVERQPNAWTTLALARAQALAGDCVTAARDPPPAVPTARPHHDESS